MENPMRKILLSMALLFTVIGLSVGVSYADQFVAGKDYKVVEQQPTSTGKKIEVLEFFWYGCPHCFHFEPFISKWVERQPANVEFIRVPTVFRPDWKVHARTYYALQDLGLSEKMHSKIFNEIHKKMHRLDTLDAMTDFLATQGVDKKVFTETYNSFSVDAKMRKAVALQNAYNIDGVPAIVINGKYKTDGAMAKSYDRLLKIMDYLVAKEGGAKAGK
jgi:thiol:disulfide interchange protein DsbA